MVDHEEAVRFAFPLETVNQFAKAHDSDSKALFMVCLAMAERLEGIFFQLREIVRIADAMGDLAMFGEGGMSDLFKQATERMQAEATTPGGKCREPDCVLMLDHPGNHVTQEELGDAVK